MDPGAPLRMSRRRVLPGSGASGGGPIWALVPRIWRIRRFCRDRTSGSEGRDRERQKVQEDFQLH